jgi:hypothetical protein
VNCKRADGVPAAQLSGQSAPLAKRRVDLCSKADELSGVNSRTLGKLLSVSLLCVAMTGRATARDDVGNVVSLGNDTYSITVQAKNALHRDVDALKSEANEAAANYCATNGKELKVVSVTDKLPTFGLGYATAKITFKALNPGDPELTAAPPAPGVPAAVAPAAPVERHLTTDELYNELVKLDDLRKKGILTDEEFQAEKKKLLSHSN